MDGRGWVAVDGWIGAGEDMARAVQARGSSSSCGPWATYAGGEWGLWWDRDPGEWGNAGWLASRVVS